MITICLIFKSNLSLSLLKIKRPDFKKINFRNLSKSLGYTNYFRITKEKDQSTNLRKFLNAKKSSFLEVIIQKNLNLKLPRPKDLISIKKNFVS